MTKYAFRMQSVLDLRIVHRDQQRSELVDAVGTLRALEVRRAELIAELQELQGHPQTDHSDCLLDLQRLVEFQRFEQVLRNQLEELRQQETSCRNEIQRRQATLEQADREVKVLQQVDQRHRHEHRQEQQRREVRQLDEIALTRRPFQ